MRNRNRYRQYLSIEAAVIILVIANFKFVPDKQIAAVIGSFLFLVSTLGILYRETKFEGFQKRASFMALMIFLIFSVIPVMGLRFLNWGVPFDELSIAGFTGKQIHQYSNYLFIAVMIAFFVDSHLEQVKLLDAQHNENKAQ